MRQCALAEDSLRDEVAVGMKGAWRSLTGAMRAPEVLQLLLRMHVSRTSLKLAWGEVPIFCGTPASFPGSSCGDKHHSALLPQWQSGIICVHEQLQLPALC